MYEPIYNTNSGVCLGADSGDYGNNGDGIELWTCDGAAEQQWYSNGTNIVNQDGLCLDANSNQYPSNGDNLQLWSCNSNSEQTWSTGSTGNIINSNKSYCVDADSISYPDNGDALQLWSCDVNDEQVWDGALGGVCINSGYGFDGYVNPTSTGWGVRDTIRHSDPYICSGAPNSDPGTSSAWSLLQGPDPSTLAQSGELINSAWSTTNVFYFSECSACYNTDGTKQTSAPVILLQETDPGTSSYTDEYSTWQNGSGVTTEQVSPVSDPTLGGDEAGYSELPWSPVAYEYLGENHWQESQTPGSNGNECDFTNVQGLNGGTWVTETSSELESAAQLGMQATYGNYTSFSGGGFGIWDTRR